VVLSGGPNVIKSNLSDLKIRNFKLEYYSVYCDQPFVSETTRYESDDFIQTIHDQDKMLCAFMCEG
jgi:hypothetical protein